MWSAVKRANVRGRISCLRRRDVPWDGRVFDTLGREGSGRVSIFIARHCAPGTSARPFATLSRTRRVTDGRRVSGRRGAAARGSTALRRSRPGWSGRRCCQPCQPQPARAWVMLSAIRKSTCCQPAHRHHPGITSAANIFYFLPYALGISSCVQTCTVLLRGRFCHCSKAFFARMSGSGPLGIRCRWYFCHMRVTGLDQLMTHCVALHATSLVSTLVCTLMIASCAVTELQMHRLVQPEEVPQGINTHGS